jgi:hypothetical protein
LSERPIVFVVGVDADLAEHPAVGVGVALHELLLFGRQTARLGPGRPGIVGAIDRRALDDSGRGKAVRVGQFLFAGIAGLVIIIDEGIKDVRLGQAQVDPDPAAGFRFRKALVDRSPGFAGVRRLPDPAARRGGVVSGIVPFRPGPLPGHGIDRVVVLRIHDQVVSTRFVVDEEDLLPGLAAVRCLEDAAVGILRPFRPAGGDIDDIGVFRMDDDTGDGVSPDEPHVRPGFPAVG